MSIRPALAVLLALASSTSRGEDSLRYRLNGLEVDATYARGREARELVSRFLEALPRDAATSPGWTARGGWRQLGALQGDVSRVLQVRGDGDDLEAIASLMNTRQSPRSESPAPLGMPPVSTLASQLQFLRPSPSSQWVFRSAWQPQALAGWLRFSASLRGWAAERSAESSGALHLRRDGKRLEVLVLPQSRSSLRGSVVVMTAWESR